MPSAGVFGQCYCGVSLPTVNPALRFTVSSIFGAGRGGKNAGTRMCRAVACLRCRVFLKMGVSFLRGCGLTAALADGYYVSAGWRRKYSRGKMGVPSGKGKRRFLSCSTLLVVVRKGSRRGVQKSRGDTSIEQDRGEGDEREGCRGPAGRPERQTDKKIIYVVCNSGNRPLTSRGTSSTERPSETAPMWDPVFNLPIRVGVHI